MIDPQEHSLDDLRHGFGFLMHDTTRLMNRYYDRRVRSPLHSLWQLHIRILTIHILDV